MLIKPELTPEQQAVVAAWRAENPTAMQGPGPLVEGFNVINGDYLEIDHAWCCYVLGSMETAVYSYIPDWGDVILAIEYLEPTNYVTDRIGPNGEQMPVQDEVQAQARAAKVAASKSNPKPAAKDDHSHRRSLEQLLRDAIKRLPHKEEKHAREVLRAAGVIGKDA